MKTLCINTAFPVAHLALEIDNRSYFQTLDANAKTSESVLPAIDDLLYSNSIKISDIDNLCVVIGPGSFTGVRIGVALAKGFAVCNKKLNLYPINSLDLMAFEYVESNVERNDFCTVQNALSGRFFVGQYDKCGNSICESSLVAELPNNKKIGLKCENLSEVDLQIEIKPETLLKYAKKLIKEDISVSAEKIAPVYLRLSQAEENLLKVTDVKN